MSFTVSSTLLIFSEISIRSFSVHFFPSRSSARRTDSISTCFSQHSSISVVNFVGWLRSHRKRIIALLWGVSGARYRSCSIALSGGTSPMFPLFCDGPFVASCCGFRPPFVNVESRSDSDAPTDTQSLVGCNSRVDQRPRSKSADCRNELSELPQRFSRAQNSFSSIAFGHRQNKSRND